MKMISAIEAYRTARHELQNGVLMDAFESEKYYGFTFGHEDGDGKGGIGTYPIFVQKQTGESTFVPINEFLSLLKKCRSISRHIFS